MRLHQTQAQLSLREERTNLHLLKVFRHRTFCPNGWEKVKRKSQIFSNLLVMKLHPLFLLMKLIPYVAREVMIMRMKPLDESKQNFLYKCRLYPTMRKMFWFLQPQILLIIWMWFEANAKLINARKQIFKWHIGETPHNLSTEDFQYLASKTDGFSGSDISICVKDALYQPVRATLDAEFFREYSPGMWVRCEGDHPKVEKCTFEELKAKVEAPKVWIR
nr:protein suppressor of k(+) transport growth defect 1 [Quercus suber]